MTQKNCFICDEEGTKKDRFTASYTLCDKSQCETDLDNYLRDMKDDDIQLAPWDDPDHMDKAMKEDPHS